MAALRIDMMKFKAACVAARKDIAERLEIGTWTAAEFSAQSSSEKREWYEFERGQFSTTPLWMQPTASIDNADELRSELRVAAQAAQQFGATPAQIDHIVALATKNGKFNVLSGGRLSKTEASRIIDVMKNGL